MRFDPAMDQDLIAWLEAQPAGRRSEAVRNLMRSGLQAHELKTELQQAVQRTISEALAGLQIVAAQQGAQLSANEIEEVFGEKLDQR